MVFNVSLFILAQRFVSVHHRTAAPNLESKLLLICTRRFETVPLGFVSNSGKLPPKYLFRLWKRKQKSLKATDTVTNTHAGGGAWRPAAKCQLFVLFTQKGTWIRKANTVWKMNFGSLRSSQEHRQHFKCQKVHKLKAGKPEKKYLLDFDEHPSTGLTERFKFNSAMKI